MKLMHSLGEIKQKHLHLVFLVNQKEQSAHKNDPSILYRVEAFHGWSQEMSLVEPVGLDLSLGPGNVTN